MEPSSFRRFFPAGRSHQRHGADDQQPLDVALVHLRGFPEDLFAAGRMLAGNEPQPRCEVAISIENLHRRREGLDRRGGDRL